MMVVDTMAGDGEQQVVEREPKTTATGQSSNHKGRNVANTLSQGGVDSSLVKTTDESTI